MNGSTVLGPMDLVVIFALIHNATTDTSTRLKHIANAYDVLINLSSKSRYDPDEQLVQPLHYHVQFEIDGGTDHRATLSQTRSHFLFFY